MVIPRPPFFQTLGEDNRVPFASRRGLGATNLDGCAYARMNVDPLIHQLIAETIAALRDLDAAACHQEIEVTRMALAGEEIVQEEILLAAMLERMAALKGRLVALQTAANSLGSITNH